MDVNGQSRRNSITPFLACRFGTVLMCLGVAWAADAQSVQTRVVVDTGVVCRVEPDQKSRPAQPLPVGTVIGVTRQRRVQGTSWYFDSWRISTRAPSCWVHGPSTMAPVPDDPEPVLLAVLDRLLRRSDLRFEAYVEAENLLTSDGFLSPDGRRNYAGTFAASGLLQFRRLQLLDRALALSAAQKQAVDRDPLKTAWMTSHQDLVAFFEPAGRWHVRPQAYWSLLERNADALWADDLAWTAAGHTSGVDECYSDCALQLIVDGPLQYWIRFPHGAHIVEALRRATELASGVAAMACSDRDPAHPERKTESPVPHAVVEQISSSLADVTPGNTRDILRSLAEAERKCVP
jgi:hypothetical protein